MRGAPRRVEIIPIEFYVGMLGLDAKERGVYASICLKILSDGEPIREKERLHRICGCGAAAIKKIFETLLGQGLIEFTAEGHIRVEWCREAYTRSRARPPQDEWKQLRAQVFERDDYTCKYCGTRGGDLECDHVVPAAQGGPASLDNLVTSCKPCNRQKGARSPDQWTQ